jgi:hypothetical protein
MFALSQLAADSLRVSLKCEPALALRETHAAVIPGYHLNKKHWNTVILDGSLPDETVRDSESGPRLPPRVGAALSALSSPQLRALWRAGMPNAP